MLKTLIATAAIAMLPAVAGAATIFATDATIEQDGPRGTANDRDNINNALGETDGTFFELGLGGIVDFTFGQLFTGPGNVVEVTFGNPAGFPESADILLGFEGVFTFLTSVPNIGAQGPGGATFDFSGTFDTVRFVDTTQTNARTGGFDIDSVSVAAVPLPAGGLLLLGALGGLGFMRRRKG
ncbi:MAG: VPLPA-CTERM sorting domain-containing protein [Hasllibacter sp.]